MSSIVKAAQKRVSGSLQINNQTNYYKAYDHPILKIHLSYPTDWKIIEKPVGFSIYVPIHNNSVCYPNAVFTVLSLVKLPIEQFISDQVDDLKQRKFTIIDSKTTTIDGNIAHSITSTVSGQDHRKAIGYNCAPDKLIAHKMMDVYAIIANKAFVFRYDASITDYSYYLGIIKNIYQSIKFKEIRNIHNGFHAGIRLHVPLADIVVNPVTNRLYVSADKVYVMDGTTNAIVENITTGGGYIDHLAINQITNTIYASSSQDGKIYVIDGYTNKIRNYFGSSHNIGGLAIDSNAGNIGTLVFVVNTINGTVSIIDGTTFEVQGKVSVGEIPSSIAIDPVTKRAYVANTKSNSVSVIDYVIYNNRTAKFKKMEDIPVGLFPTSIVVNSNTDKVYVANSGINTVSLIDYDNRTAKFKKMEDIPVGLFPTSLSIAPDNDKIYIAYAGSTIASVMDIPVHDEDIMKTHIRNINIGNLATSVTLNPINKIMYASSSDDRMISLTNVTSGKPLVVITFNANPPVGGYIQCNGRRISNEHLTYDINTQLKCDAIPNGGFQFSSWISNLANLHNANLFSHSIPVNASNFGTLGATFIQPTQLSVPTELWAPLYALIPGFFVPSIITWLNDKRKRKYVKQCMDQIGKLDKSTIERQIVRLYMEGKIDESQHDFLVDKINDNYK